GVAQARVAVAAAAWRAHLHPVAGRELVAFALGDVLWHRGLAGLTDNQLVGRAGQTSLQTGRAVAAMVHQERGGRGAAQQAHAIADAVAAPMAAGARGALAQGVLLE